MARARQRIGPMRHRITVEQYAETDDGYGGASQSWSTRETVWADMQHKTLTGETAAGGQLIDRTQIDFVVRDSAGIRQGDRISFDGRFFLVQAVANEDERGRFKRVVTVEREQE